MTYLQVLLSIYLGTVSWATQVVTTTPPMDIYWNKTNEIFMSSNNDHILEVQLKDRIRFVCPYYTDSTTSESQFEHYVIYRVPKHYYDSCYLPAYTREEDLVSMGIEKVHNCSSPSSFSFFTSLIDDFLSLPGPWGGLTYRAGEAYYFTSISTGYRDGLHNRASESSACKQYNMKAIVRVCCNDNFTDPPTESPNTRETTPTTRHTTRKMTLTTRLTTRSTRRLTTTEATTTASQIGGSGSQVGDGVTQASSISRPSLVVLLVSLTICLRTLR